MLARGIIYEYEDGGRYVGEWDKDASNGYGVCTGPRGHGVYEGAWEHGFQVSGVYTWPNGMKYMGPWSSNMREGTGKEERPDGTEYSGDFTHGSRGPYGVSRLPNGVYRGTWSNGAQDGEGVERYLDGGFYRGEYKKGVRHGYGTRTSCSYEHRHTTDSPDYGTLPKRGSEPSFEHGSMIKQESSASVFSVQSSKTNIDLPVPSSARAGSIQVSAVQPQSDPDLNAQIYEGEWRDDRRHGHGVLKVLGHYTYYGDWENNSRTGYGVLVYDGGKKEEGQWQNGKLIVVLKRRKLVLKNSQLETSVRQAHTKAIQAADMARNKALLAESRAAAASTKSKQAHTFAQDALKNAQLARERAELYKNAPRISEGLKTPMIAEKHLAFPEVDMSLPPSSSPLTSRSANVKGSLNDVLESHHTLLPPRDSVSISPSFEDLQTWQEGNSDSEESIESERRDQVSKLDSYSTDSIRRRRKDLHKQDSGMFSFEELDKVETPSSGRSKVVERFERRRSDPVAASDGGSRTRHTRSGSTGSGGRLSPNTLTRRDKTTGEMNHGDLTDDESLDDKNRPDSGLSSSSLTVCLPPHPRPLNKTTSAMTLEMLNQMASWNKMIAYINFGLLIFLLLLILGVVMSIHYYNLTNYYYNHPPEDQSPAAAGFMSPLAA